MQTPTKSGLAMGADALTVARMLIAVALVPIAWAGSWTSAAALLSLAWISDVLDGRLARRAVGESMLGRFDLIADTAVGAGLLLGLVGHGTIQPWAGLGALVVFGALFWAGNLAAAMLLQLTGYVPFLYVLGRETPTGWWLPFASAVVIGGIDWRRLVLISIPAFLRGMTGQFERRLPARGGEGWWTP
jgi:phosphatidylglycerophosphate synthase